MAPKRVVICGVTGSGKSALAVRVAALLNIPFVSSDEVYWLPGWQSRDREDLRSQYRAIAAMPAWAVDSLPTSGRDLLLDRADLVVALDLGRWLTLWRLTRRTFDRLRSGAEIHNGNVETIANVLGRNSIVLWHFRSFSRWRRTISSLENDPSTPPIVVLRSPSAVEAWLNSVTTPPGETHSPETDPEESPS